MSGVERRSLARDAFVTSTYEVPSGDLYVEMTIRVHGKSIGKVCLDVASAAYLRDILMPAGHEVAP